MIRRLSEEPFHDGRAHDRAGEARAPVAERGSVAFEVRGIKKRYGHVEALVGADFAVDAGEVVALIGDNGAGKSTLVKVMAGAIQPDDGELLINGRPVHLTSPIHARALGIETVYQDLALAPDLGPAENTFVGRELVKPGLLGKLGVLDKKTMRIRAAEAFTSLGTDVKDLDAAVGELSGGQRQSVAICRSIMWASKVIFMDEPTAALGVRQTRNVLKLIRRVAEGGVAVVFISHNMPEVLEAADRVEVLRLGRRVARFRTEDTDVEELVGAMTGALDAVTE
jgi:simple sugar transport system ATP-binding protein